MCLVLSGFQVDYHRDHLLDANLMNLNVPAMST